MAEGVEIPYVEHGPATAPCVVLIHGLGDSWRSYELVLRHLAHDARALVPSMRGHGEADRPDSGYAVADFAADVVALLDEAGVGAAVIGGHSSASFVAQHLAAAYPERVSGLVLIGAPGSLKDHPGTRDLDAVFAAMTDPIDPAFVRGFTEGLVAGPVPSDFLDAQVNEVLKVPARVVRETWAGVRDFDPSGVVGRITVPTLVVWGDADGVPVASRDVQDALIQSIPRAQLVVYSGVGHCPHWERPGRFAADLVAFVQRATMGTPIVPSD
ncbi:MAG TPA: alpha/beta hydrolase [Acidimicrobiales bacterium]